VALALGPHLPAGRVVGPFLAGEEDLPAEAGALAGADAECLPRAELPVAPNPLPELTLELRQLLPPRITLREPRRCRFAGHRLCLRSRSGSVRVRSRRWLWVENA
jgi:hypothetical protein